VNGDQRPVHDILRGLDTIARSTRPRILRSRDREAIRIYATILSDQCLDAVHVLDYNDPDIRLIGLALNDVSFAAQELAEDIANARKTDSGYQALRIAHALETARHPKLRIEYELIRLRASLHDFSAAIVKVLDIQVSTDLSQREQSDRPVSLAKALLVAATGLLPAANRLRYEAEFRSELAVIAAARGSYREQLVYAARLLLAAPRLRTELKAPRRRSAPQ